MKARRVVTVALSVLFTLGILGGPAAADETEEQSVEASYNGRTIDLQEDWEGAEYCAVHSEDDVRCYDSEAEMVEDEGGPSLSPLAKDDCPSGVLEHEWYCLFSYEDWDMTPADARMLKFKDPGCQSLATYDFANQASSWVNTLGDDVDNFELSGCGYHQFTASPHSSSSSMGAYNNSVSSINILR